MREDEKHRLSKICYDSKKGVKISCADNHFIADMYNSYPEEYKDIQQAASDKATREVNPLGAG